LVNAAAALLDPSRSEPVVFVLGGGHSRRLAARRRRASMSDYETP
jgi:hypothetical protein